MQKGIQLIIIALLPLSVSVLACAPKSKLADFKWLLGTWRMEVNEQYIVEEWKQLNDSTFEGTGYKHPVNDTTQKTSTEAVQLVYRKGEIFYVPTVVGQNKGQPVYFRFTGKEKEEYKFENKEHDFPQRIIYKPTSDKILYARVEGVRNERFNAFEFEYTRIGK